MDLPRPSRKILILIGAAGVFVAGLLIQKNWNYIFSAPKPPALVDVGYTATAPSQMGTFEGDASVIDANHDGIPDWKEEIIGTSTDMTANGTGSTTAAVPDTVTANVAKDIFANTAYAANNGQDMSQDDQNALVQNLLTQVQNSFYYKTYDTSGLQTIANETPDTIRFYATSFAALQLGMIFEMENDADAISQNVGVMGDIYSKEAQSLYELKVPPELAATHLEIVNNFSRAAASFKAIANETNDPVEVPVAIQVYEQASAEQDGLLLQVAQFIKSSGIIFSSDEVGSYWDSVESSVGGGTQAQTQTQSQ